MSHVIFDVPTQTSEAARSRAFPNPQEPTVARATAWTTRYRSRVISTDVIVVAVAMSTALVFPRVAFTHNRHVGFLVLAAALWMAALAVFDSRNARTLGTGTNEYKSLFDATLAFLGVLVIACFVFDIDLRRSDLLPAVPLGFALLLIGRWSWRQWLRRERAQGRALSRAVLVGSTGTVAHTLNQLQRHPDAGYLVVGTVVPEAHETEAGGDLLFEELRATLEHSRADTVMVTSSDDLTPERMRRLSWDLERHDHRLVITPSLTDVAASRIRTQPVAGLPLIHVESPTYTGVQRLVKRLVDIVGSGVLLVLFSPVLLVVGVLVKTTSRGPVFYKQERVGRNTQTFGIFKFRSMVVDADARLQSLLAEQGTSDTPLFKIQSDPRLTPVGAILRRFSLDELPQLINVLLGDMSLVGPRPQRPAEVALYDDAAHRRLNVRPGMTGLWQVSGRSRLTWDESLRLDLYYIENWTLMVDLVILWRTFRAVVGSDGAY